MNTLENMYQKALEEKNRLTSKALSAMTQKAWHHQEYFKNKEKEDHEAMFQALAFRERWPYYQILTTEELAQLALLEHLLEKDSSDVKKYIPWKKPGSNF